MTLTTAHSPNSLWMNTMKRCTITRSALRRSLTLALGLTALGLGTSASAQIQTRNFPAAALRGTMVVIQPPWVTVDGIAVQLSPGARIRGADNLLVLSGSLVGQTLLVNYLLAPGGLVHEVWILTESEAALARPRAADLAN